MENLDPKPTTVSPQSDSLQEQIESLRHLVTSMLVLVIIASGAFNIYLWRQVKYARSDLNAYRPQAAQLVSDYERISQPALKEFTAKLIEFGKSGRADESFNALLRKYNIIGSNAPASAASSAPAATPAKAPAKGK